MANHLIIGHTVQWYNEKCNAFARKSFESNVKAGIFQLKKLLSFWKNPISSLKEKFQPIRTNSIEYSEDAIASECAMRFALLACDSNKSDEIISKCKILDLKILLKLENCNAIQLQNEGKRGGNIVLDYESK